MQPAPRHQLQDHGHRDRLHRHEADQHEQLHRARLPGRRPAQQHAHERPRQRDEPHGPGLVEAREQRVRRRLPRHFQPRVARGEPQGEARLHFTVPGGELVEGAAPGEDGGGEGAADEDARHRHEGDAPRWHEPGQQQRDHHGSHARGDGRSRPPPGPVAGDAAPGRADGHAVHEQQEEQQQRYGSDDPGDDQGHGGELEGGAQPGEDDLAWRAQPGDRADGGGDGQQDGQDGTEGGIDRQQHALTLGAPARRAAEAAADRARAARTAGRAGERGGSRSVSAAGRTHRWRRRIGRPVPERAERSAPGAGRSAGGGDGIGGLLGREGPGRQRPRPARRAGQYFQWGRSGSVERYRQWVVRPLAATVDRPTSALRQYWPAL